MEQKQEKTLDQRLQEILDTTEELVGESDKKIDYHQFLVDVSFTLAEKEVEEDRNFDDIEEYLANAVILLREYEQGESLTESWNNHFNQYVEELNGWLAEKLA